MSDLDYILNAQGDAAADSQNTASTAMAIDKGDAAAQQEHEARARERKERKARKAGKQTSAGLQHKTPAVKIEAASQTAHSTATAAKGKPSVKIEKAETDTESMDTRADADTDALPRSAAHQRQTRTPSTSAARSQTHTGAPTDADTHADAFYIDTQGDAAETEEKQRESQLPPATLAYFQQICDTIEQKQQQEQMQQQETEELSLLIDAAFAEMRGQGLRSLFCVLRLCVFRVHITNWCCVAPFFLVSFYLHVLEIYPCTHNLDGF